MASINPSTPSTNQQLAGINNTVPMPRGPAPTLADGSPFSLSPNNSLSLGGSSGNGYVITTGPAAQPAGGSILVGGGGAPANGAQPAAPGATAAAAGTAPPVPTNNARPLAGDELQAANAPDIQGFGRADKDARMTVSTGGFSFGFPSFNASRKSSTAPKISWDPAWKRVEKDGMWYMEAPNGVKAVPAVEYRIHPKPAEKVSTVKVANGWGKKFPDGTIVVFDRTEGAYRLDSKGRKHKLPLGTHTIAGVKVRVFEAAVVRTLDANGGVEVFDSRGNASKGSSRGRFAASLGAADAGASTTGGGKPGMLAADGKPRTTEQLTSDVQHLTGVARGLLAEVRSGNVDPARLASLQAQLNALPSGILQAAGAAGTMTSDGTRVAGSSGSGIAAPPPPGSTAAAGGGATPTPGNDANANSKELAAGATAKLEGATPDALKGGRARFAQLPQEVQEAVAKAFGSTEGAAAFKADQLLEFSTSGHVRVVGGATLFVRRTPKVLGAGPGQDLAMTMRPGRQPGTPAPNGIGGRVAQPVRGGGTSSAHGHASHGGHAGSTSGTRPRPSGNTVTVGGGPTPSRASMIKLFPAGGEMRHVDLGGINGSFTWKTLPAKAKAAILDFLRNEKSDPAAKAFASRTGSGWTIDPSASIVIEAGFAQFVGGLTMTRRGSSTTTPSRPPVSGGGASSQPGGHGATRPPVSGGGAGIGTVAPGTPPPAPAVDDPGERDHIGHRH